MLSYLVKQSIITGLQDPSQVFESIEFVLVLVKVSLAHDKQIILCPLAPFKPG